MNLSLILNMTPASVPAALPAAATVQEKIPVEMASFQDFLSLMGLSPMATAAGPELGEGYAAAADPAMLAAMPGSETGNPLPPALPVLPDTAAVPVDPALLAQPLMAGPAATLLPASAEQPHRGPAGNAPAAPLAWQPQAEAVHVPASTTSLPVPPEALAEAVAEAVAPAQLARVQSPATQSPATQPTIAFDLSLPAAAQPQPQAPAQQAAAQPVLAQLLQTNPRAAQRKGGEEAAISATGSVSAEDLSAETVRPATPAPILPVTAIAALAAATPDIAPAQQAAAPTVSSPATTTERHDFTAMIDKLTEARELARPGRADMHLAHREFGQVSVQFELAGHALKVAMTSADPGFAPAVQAALADRPVAPATDAARADNQPQRNDAVSASTASWQAGPQADGQRQDGQHRAQQARPGHAPVRQNASDSDNAGGTAPGRDGSRFA